VRLIETDFPERHCQCGALVKHGTRRCRKCRARSRWYRTSRGPSAGASRAGAARDHRGPRRLRSARGATAPRALARVHLFHRWCVCSADGLARNDARLDAIYCCPHDYGECHCRKPDTGLFEQAFQNFPQANAGNSVLIGDSLSDIQAGLRLGMKTIFIQGEPNRQKEGAEVAATLADAVASSLLQAVEVHLGLTAPGGRASDVEPN